MNEIVEEWVCKAEGDYATARRELAVTVDPNYDAVCFHAQQCIEKLLKAALIQRGSVPPKTHDLYQLRLLLKPPPAPGEMSTEALRYLTRAALDFRYPGEFADLEQARQALQIRESLRSALLPRLGAEM